MINANFDGQLGGDKRYETTASGGSYVTYADALAFAQAQNSPVASVILALDSGWQQTDGTGDQILTLENVQVITSLPTNDTFSPPSRGAIQTCTLPPAQILVNKTSGLDQGSVNEVLSVSGADTTGYFRVVDWQVHIQSGCVAAARSWRLLRQCANQRHAGHQPGYIHAEVA